MVQTPVRFKKGIAIELRKKGFSYSDIQNSINIPRSTIAYWLKDIELSDEQAKKLKAKRSAVAKSNSEKRTARILRETEDIKRSSAKKIGDITKRELWLMGIVLYWKFGNESDLRKGINFTSSDPYLIKLFLKWRKDIGRIGDEEILFDIFLGKNKKDSLDRIKNYWASITGFSKGYFTRVYFYKTGKSELGLLRVRVKASSMLARQMAGWIEGIRRSL
ncbi:MAG: hypothetical protein HYT67_01935 [Candidatus Yanofskybacteria bacterium]|nr:hypothetical protein [Candidatus Yanofskybacteria bacterium]